MSVWQILLLLVAGGFFLTLIFTIGPLYITNFTVQSTVKDLIKDPELATKSVQEIRLAIERKFNVNQVEVVQAVCRDKQLTCMKIEKTKTTVKIDANYEARVHVMANVDAVVVFNDNVIEIPIPGAG
jgi:hypothetical protein